MRPEAEPAISQGSGQNGTLRIPRLQQEPSPTSPTSSTQIRLAITFFLFGLLNNSLYVVILTAALELLPKGVPTGVVAFANIFPALIAKALWPYVLKGRVRYTKRIWSCSVISFVGMLLIALFPSLTIRLSGIALASFSSGLGELTYLQLATRYKSSAGHGVGWFASGTGAAGLVGASAWWIVRPLGVKLGLGILSLLPWFMVGSYLLILPSPEQVAAENDANTYAALPTDADVLGDDSDDEDEQPESAAAATEVGVSAPDAAALGGKSAAGGVKLSFLDKMQLLKPMLLPFILPLVLVYFFEYTINQGVAPTLLYPLPTSDKHPLLALMIKKLSDYYPLYQLTYQTFVFLSRSSVSIFRLPAIPKSWLWLPAILQGTLLAILTTESLYAWFRASIASPISIVLICVEGLAGGYAYVSVFYQIGMSPSESTAIQVQDGRAYPAGATDDDEAGAAARAAQEHEFRIGCVGVGDSFGILLASLISMPLELQLCKSQVSQGRTLCKQVE